MTKEESDELDKLIAEINEELDNGSPRPPVDDGEEMQVFMLPTPRPTKPS